MASSGEAWAAVRRAFEAQLPEPGAREAPDGVSAVLLTLVPDGAHGPALLYTRRTETLRSHPGEVSFPGGRVDATDASPLAAALREAEEEVGLRPSDVEVLGHLTDFLTFRQVLVCAYVAALREGVEPPRAPRSLEEVDEVFHVPVATLMDARVYEARALEGMPEPRRVHYWHLPRHTVWGITGELTARYLQRVHGWTPPSEARRVASPEELLPRPRPASRRPTSA